jgi:hypothetical protein
MAANAGGDLIRLLWPCHHLRELAGRGTFASVLFGRSRPAPRRRRGHLPDYANSSDARNVGYDQASDVPCGFSPRRRRTVCSLSYDTWVAGRFVSRMAASSCRGSVAPPSASPMNSRSRYNGRLVASLLTASMAVRSIPGNWTASQTRLIRRAPAEFTGIGLFRTKSMPVRTLEESL